MSVKIGHASIDERGKISGGQAGDQTKKEVCTRSWYSHPWTTVIRPNDAYVGEKIANCMEQICANDNIGYDQSQRTTLYTQAKAKNWNCSKITTKCETDCSATVSVCVNAAGITVSKDMYTGNEKTLLSNTGKFVIYTSSKYTGASTYLRRGDILLGNGHTAVVLSNGNGAFKPYSVITTKANVMVRKEPATKSKTKIIKKLPKGTKRNIISVKTVGKNTYGQIKSTGYWINLKNTKKI